MKVVFLIIKAIKPGDKYKIKIKKLKDSFGDF
jgi:predicted RNA-binding protein with TRAM domain